MVDGGGMVVVDSTVGVSRLEGLRLEFARVVRAVDGRSAAVVFEGAQKSRDNRPDLFTRVDKVHNEVATAGVYEGEEVAASVARGGVNGAANV